MAESISASTWYDRIDVVASVPTHWTRRLRRSFHAADALAILIAKRLKLPYAALLKRIRGGPHQIGLKYEERRANVRDAFAMCRGAELRAARVLLVDDVKTTGATVNECAGVLKKAGAAEVYVAVVALAGGDPDRSPVPRDA
jgi:ComF family protein